MQHRKLHSFFLLLAVINYNPLSTCAFREAPSASVREQMATISEEDVIVMQAEMAWGAEEMKRYKNLRGDWPIRSSVLESDNEHSNFRGASTQAQQGQPHHEYWNYLVSMF